MLAPVGMANRDHSHVPRVARVVLGIPPSLTRTPTSTSGVSIKSQYTAESAGESAEAHGNTGIRDVDSNGRKDRIGDEEKTADTIGGGVDCEDKGAALSPDSTSSKRL